MSTGDDTVRVALITGANKGIGQATARRLGELGYAVLLGARDPDRGAAAAAGLRAAGADATAIALDVTAPASIEAAARWTRERYGRLDVLVNNAAIALDDAPPSELDLAVLRRTYETNVFGLIAVTQALVPLLRKAPAGRIVNLSSGSGSLTLVSGPDWRPEWNGLAYNTSKSVVNAFTVLLATELRDTAIKVNAVNPGYTATDMSPAADRPAESAAAVVVRYATLPDDGPSGGFFDENGPVPW